MARRYQHMSWKQAAWMVVGAMLLVLGLGCCQLSVYDVQLLAFGHRYIDAELEITKYDYHGVETGQSTSKSYRHGRGNKSSRPNDIEGVIHPGDIPVRTNDRNVSLAILDESDSVVVNKPLRQEVEGQRIPVLFWDGDATDQRWYHPPRVMTAVRPSPVRVGVSVVLCFGLLFGAVACFRYGYNRRRAAVQNAAERRPSPWPPWTGFCLAGAVLTWPLWWLITLAFTTGTKVSPNGTQRLAFTSGDWLMAAVMIGMFGILPLLSAVMLVVAVRRRLAFSRSPATRP